LQGSHAPRLVHFLGKWMQVQDSTAFYRSLGRVEDAEALPVAYRQKEKFP
jgi:hypothetical protein